MRLGGVYETRGDSHISMLALGGAIGAGLLVGSSAVIASTGPGAFITYAITGLIVALMMRMLGEMAAAQEYLADTDP